MRSNNVNLVDVQHDFRSTYSEKNIARVFIECGFFPRMLLKPVFDYLLDVGGVSPSRAHSSFKKLTVFSYYFRNQLALWNPDIGTPNDGYFMDMAGNHIYFALEFADTIRGENIVRFGMKDKYKVPQKMKKYAARMRRDARAVNLEIKRVAKEYYALPCGVAQEINEEFDKFFKEAKSLLEHDKYITAYEEDGFAMMSHRESTLRGCVFMCDNTGLVGKIWLKNHSYLSGKSWPGQVELSIMFEDKAVEDAMRALAVDLNDLIVVNGLHIVEYEQEQIARKLRGEHTDFSFKCSEIDGFEYKV